MGSGDKSFYAISSDGVKLWSFQTGGFVDSSPAIGADGTVYVGSTDGKVYAIYGDSPLSFSRWPRFRGSNEATGRMDPYRQWVEAQNLSEPNPFSDPDGDDLENILEWAFCTDPNAAGLSDVEFPYTLFSEEGLLLKAEWVMEAQGMAFEFSDNLVDWDKLDLKSPDSYAWLESVSTESVGEKLQVQLNLNAASSLPKFFRLTGIQH